MDCSRPIIISSDYLAGLRVEQKHYSPLAEIDCMQFFAFLSYCGGIPGFEDLPRHDYVNLRLSRLNLWPKPSRSVESPSKTTSVMLAHAV